MLAINLCIGDYASDVAGWIGALLRRQLGKIFLEISDRTDHQLRDLFGRHVGHAGLVQILILPAKHLLRQEQHPLFILFWHAQYLHHDVQRIGRGNQRHKIGNPIIRFASRDKAIHRGLCQRGNLGLHRLQIFRHEPFLGQLPVFGMDRRIERHQRVDQMRGYRR